MCLSSLCSRNSESKPSPNGVWDFKSSRNVMTNKNTQEPHSSLGEESYEIANLSLVLTVCGTVIVPETGAD